MRTHAERRPRRWLSVGAGLGAVLAVALTAACGPVSATAEPTATPGSETPITTTEAPIDGGQTQMPTTTAAPPPTLDPTLVPLPAYQIIVKVEPPLASHPCQPAGSIEVYGSGFPVTVTHEWRRRPANGSGNGVLLGTAVTHGYNVAGGKAISPQKLPAGDWQVRLRVTSPKVVESAWVTHNGCKLPLVGG